MNQNDCKFTSQNLVSNLHFDLLVNGRFRSSIISDQLPADLGHLLQEYFAQVEICRVHQDWHEALEVSWREHFKMGDGVIVTIDIC